jgi:hypothetical protein
MHGQHADRPAISQQGRGLHRPVPGGARFCKAWLERRVFLDILDRDLPPASAMPQAEPLDASTSRKWSKKRCEKLRWAPIRSVLLAPS